MKGIFLPRPGFVQSVLDQTRPGFGKVLRTVKAEFLAGPASENDIVLEFRFTILFQLRNVLGNFQHARDPRRVVVGATMNL